ncbi:uncharacterized protein K452DRAFT_12927 [Aplosporella prunicola CBS 121167]|uniref:Uncharacterized protein n=1 Tax=Aplosporella prunicola CBS 121167 TaxID=1176127 RepID=A0A6A6BHU9_9PEZI|nr:uncharacterized protein K452DRAFT_12927 [Aplosporella prunicola CBS 121167]KAF2142915.1 hypothetical protein K452DRAFT_12927 [Aplosporella prunicola CBS 121167]
MANNFYIQLPANQTPPTAKPVGRRPPLTPSSVSPPSLTTHNSCASRHDAGTPPVKATTILTRMASHSSTRARNSQSSPPQSPEDRQSMHADSSDYWFSERKEGGYISFPDFEKYCQSTASSERSDSHSEYQEDRT